MRRQVDVLKDRKSDISLVDHMGGDYSVVRAARVSYAGDDQDWRGEKDEKLIRYMADHGHGTPFEHTAVTFHVACPLFVRGQWHRHRIGWSYNEISRRYTSENIEFHIPQGTHLRLQDKTNKQSSNGLLADIDEAAWDITHEIIDASYDQLELYQSMIDRGVCREQARMVLPQNTYTRFYATTNLRAAALFIKLRTDSHAQKEIRVYAESMREQLRELFPVSIAALCDTQEVIEPVVPWYAKIPVFGNLMWKG